MSLNKCKFYAGGISPCRVSELSLVLGFNSGSLPFSYLGIPLFKGKPRKRHLQSILDRIKLKLASWKGLLLTFMGRVQLIKSVIHGMLA